MSPAVVRVHPRQTPADRGLTTVDVEADERVADLADRLEEWIEPRPPWLLLLREGHEFGRANNVEAVVSFTSGEMGATATFRLDQVDRAEEQGDELALMLEEENGIAKVLRLSRHGLALELFHILTIT